MSACSCGAPINPRWSTCLACGAVLPIPGTAGDPWPEGISRPAVKPGCECALCDPTRHGYANQYEAARAMSPEALERVEVGGVPERDVERG